MLPLLQEVINGIRTGFDPKSNTRAYQAERVEPGQVPNRTREKTKHNGCSNAKAMGNAAGTGCRYIDRPDGRARAGDPRPGKMAARTGENPKSATARSNRLGQMSQQDNIRPTQTLD
jgi:hypothetical protein